MAKEAVGIRLEVKAIRSLKIVAAERDVPLSALVEEAIAQWWEKQPEAKTKGALFPKEVSSQTTATPAVSQTEASPAK